MAAWALPPLDRAAVASGVSSPVINQSTVTPRTSAMRARSREESARIPLSDLDSLESSRPISDAKVRWLSPDALINSRTRSTVVLILAIIATRLRLSQSGGVGPPRGQGLPQLVGES